MPQNKKTSFLGQWSGVPGNTDLHLYRFCHINIINLANGKRYISIGILMYRSKVEKNKHGWRLSSNRGDIIIGLTVIFVFGG